MKLSLIYGLLASILITLSESRPKPKNIWSAAFNTVTEPYFDIIKNFQVQVNQSISTLQSLVENVVNPQNSTQQEAQLSYLNFVHHVDSEESGIDIQDDIDIDTNTSRILQQSPFCSNVGILFRTPVRVYTCDGIEVNNETYHSKNGTGCHTEMLLKYLCYCPFEYYGDRCGKVNKIGCEIERISHPATCKANDTADNISSDDVAPSCYKVGENETVTMITKAVCKTEFPQYNFEGIKHTLYEVVTKPNLGEHPFTYAVDGADLKLTSMPSNIRQKIMFYNWNAISEPYTIVKPLSPLEVAGNSTIAVEIPSSVLEKSVFAGRYYYELSIRKNVTEETSETLSTGYYGGYLDQANFEEPTIIKNNDMTLIIVLPVVGVILLFGTGIGYYLYRKRKEKAMYSAVNDTSMLNDSMQSVQSTSFSRDHSNFSRDQRNFTQ